MSVCRAGLQRILRGTGWHPLVQVPLQQGLGKPPALIRLAIRSASDAPVQEPTLRIMQSAGPEQVWLSL